MGVASEFVNFFQPTTRPTKTYFSYDFRVVWQSPRSCKLLQNLTTLRCHGRGREFESRRPRHSFQSTCSKLGFSNVGTKNER